LTVFLDPEQAHVIVDRLGLHIRDEGLLYSALARPAAGMFGADAYTTIEAKAAALISSLAQNHALFDGNKRLSLILTFTFIRLNGYAITFTNEEAFDLVMAVARKELELDEIAARIRARIQ
jgi:death-on-curing protein